MKLNAYAAAIAANMDEIGDAVRAALPGRACFALFTTSEEGEQAALVSNISRSAVRALVGEWLVTHSQREDDHEGDSGGDAAVGSERVDQSQGLEHDVGGAPVDGGVRGEASGGRHDDPEGSGGPVHRGLPTGLTFSRQVTCCLDYIAVMEDCFGTLLAATTRDNRDDYDELMAKLRDHMARAPGVMDAMLKSGVRPHRQAHLDALAELPTAPFAPGNPTQH